MRFRSSLLLMGIVLLGCGGAVAPSGVRARDALASALSSGDAVALAAQLETVPDELDLEDARSELQERGAALAAAPVTERARIYLRAGGVILLVRDDEGWRVDAGLLGVPTLATPLDALASLAAALERVHASRLTAVLSRQSRLVFGDELARWERGLADLNAIPILIEEDHATATLPTGVLIELVREAGDWRVEDIHDAL